MCGFIGSEVLICPYNDSLAHPLIEGPLVPARPHPLRTPEPSLSSPRLVDEYIENIFHDV